MNVLNPLVLTSLSPLIGVIFLIFTKSQSTKLCSMVGLISSGTTFLLSLIIWLYFDETTTLMQYNVSYVWMKSLNLYYTMGVDGMSMFFMMLTTFLVLMCILLTWESMIYHVKEYLLAFLILEFLLMQVFCVLDLFLFYLYFESVLIPMFLMMGIWGSSHRKISAAYQFFLYTLVGSLLMLTALVLMYFIAGTTDLLVLQNFEFTEQQQIYFWLAFFASFAVKMPMVPFHMWLPEAHAEAPTGGSVMLAGVLLKLGGYGFISFSLPLFPAASMYFTPLIFMLSILAAMYASLTTLSQMDLKKIVAYSSVAHMSFVTIGIFSLNVQGMEGSLFLMLSHGMVSSALFLCMGVLYDSYKTSLMKYYGGMSQMMPLFSIYFLFFSFANMGFPGTSSFMGEMLVLLGVFQFNLFLTLCMSFSIMFSACYSIWLLNSINFGLLKLDYLKKFQDLSSSEFWVLNPLVFIVLLMGILPNVFLGPMHMSIYKLLEFCI